MSDPIEVPKPVAKQPQEIAAMMPSVEEKQHATQEAKRVSSEYLRGLKYVPLGKTLVLKKKNGDFDEGTGRELAYSANGNIAVFAKKIGLDISLRVKDIEEARIPLPSKAQKDEGMAKVMSVRIRKDGDEKTFTLVTKPESTTFTVSDKRDIVMLRAEEIHGTGVLTVDRRRELS